MNPPADTHASPAGPDDLLTGLPWLASWKSVYLFVTGCLVTWVVLLVVLKRAFS